MLLPLSRKRASALENQQLDVHRCKMFLAILVLFKICKPTYMLKYMIVFVRRKKTWQDSCKSFVNWSKNVNLFYTITLSKTHPFLFKTRETISVQTDHCCFSGEGKQDRKPSGAKMLSSEATTVAKTKTVLPR